MSWTLQQNTNLERFLPRVGGGEPKGAGMDSVGVSATFKSLPPNDVRDACDDVLSVAMDNGRVPPPTPKGDSGGAKRGELPRGRAVLGVDEGVA
jgi:hypothetical protein